MFMKSFTWSKQYEEMATIGNSEKRFRRIVIPMYERVTGFATAWELHNQGKIDPST